ncbi:MEMO1 family [Phyllosticta citrichinensis]
MPSREASHAGSWYSSSKSTLSSELDQWLEAVPASTEGIRPASQDITIDLPSAGARAIIAPHAGYAYSGPAAAWAYKALDLSNAKRVFLLGPSHHYYLTGCALSECDTYETPLGNLKIDTETVAELHKKGKFDKMSVSQDEDEHSLEMHLPYIYKMMSRQFSDPDQFPPVVPILVGATSGATERQYGEILAPYLADPTTVFIISSDFCHWGSRFRYTYYESAPGGSRSLRTSDAPPKQPAIHESISNVDGYCMDAVESKSHKNFLEILEETGNTVCGRHPIGVVMAAIETLSLEEEKGKFRFVRYERSSDCVTPRDSSVSYCSALAIF